ncbi:hypothetical protein F5887DRAFT_1072690 [Amanita rubescens]|nr:hypothetical protein F5887DRAFT_1072690 [Amanita rubescens]
MPASGLLDFQEHMKFLTDAGGVWVRESGNLKGGIEQLTFSGAPDMHSRGHDVLLMVDVHPANYITRLGYRGKIRWKQILPAQVQLPLIWKRETTVSISQFVDGSKIQIVEQATVMNIPATGGTGNPGPLHYRSYFFKILEKGTTSEG